MASILVLVGQKSPKRDEHEEVYDYDQIFHSFGQDVEFMKDVRHRFLLARELKPKNLLGSWNWGDKPNGFETFFCRMTLDAFQSNRFLLHGLVAPDALTMVRSQDPRFAQLFPIKRSAVA
jgi:hypothetical protein